MYRRIFEVRDIEGTHTDRTVYGGPNECPRCHIRVTPIPLSAVYFDDGLFFYIEEAFQCTNHECAKMFVAVYQATELGGRFHFEKSIPLDPFTPAVSELIAKVSPDFVETYGQALSAETYGLPQLTGLGLRKALEFLVKDFAIHQYPDEKETIVSKPLGSCVNDYLADPKLRAMAKRATWLGNDETHYVRRWADKDISDLKVLIRVTMNWLDTVLLTEQYESEMPEATKR